MGQEDARINPHPTNRVVSRAHCARAIGLIWVLLFCCPCWARALPPGRMTFQTMSDVTISPGGTKAARSDTVLLGGRILVSYLQLAPVRTFRLLVLDQDLRVAGSADLFSERDQTTDIRVCQGPGASFFCAFETTAGRGGVTNHLNLARYEAGGTEPLLLTSRAQVDEAMPVIIPDQLPRPGDDLMDDPTPFFYRDRFYVITRKWESATLKVRVFSADLGSIETHELDLGHAFPGLNLSVNSLVDIEGTPYLVAGAFRGPPSDPRSSSHLVAVGLNASLTTPGRPIVLSKTGAYEGYVACARYCEGVLLVGYDILTRGQPSGHRGMIKAFDPRSGFSEIGALEVNAGRMVDNHFTFEVLGRKLYVVYQTPGEEIRARIVSLTGGPR